MFEGVTAEWISAWANVVLAIAAILGGIAAFGGLQTWRQSLRGQTEHELARRTLVTIYRLQDQIDAVRNPFMFSDEWKDRPGYAPKGAIDPEDLTYAYSKRWQLLSEQNSQHRANFLECRAVWGTILGEANEKLQRMISDLNYAINMHLEIKRNNLRRQDIGDDEFNRIRSIVKMTFLPQELSKFDVELNTCVQLFESLLRPYISLHKPSK